MRNLGVPILLLALLAFGAPVQAATDWVAAVRAAAQRAQVPERAVAVAAIPMAGGGRSQYLNADQPFAPASTMKVVTAYAGLELVGPAFRWYTRLYTDGQVRGDTLQGNLYFVASGDPKLTQERLWLMLRELRSQGIRQIDGDLVLDDSYFHLPATWPVFNDDGNDPLAPFLVEPHGLLTNLNSHQITLRARDGKVSAWMEPAMAGLKLETDITVSAPGACPTRRNFSWQPSQDRRGQVTLTVRGTLPNGCTVSRYASVLYPDAYTAGLLRGIWAEMGGHWRGDVRLGQLQAGTSLLASSPSPDLTTMVRDINKYSSNPMARMLYLNIGAQNRLPGDANDFVSTERVIREWMTKKGIPVAGLVLDNGSGLSRLERISARQMTLLLEQAWQSPFAAELVASMPLVALDGTLHSRLRNTELVGEGHLKTGSLSGVRAIAGYLRDRDGVTWAVTIFINHRGHVPDRVIDDMLKALRSAG